MKKSNILLFSLLAIFVSFYVANMAYHKYNLDNNTGHIHPCDFLNIKSDLIKVVHFKGQNTRVAEKYVFCKIKGSSYSSFIEGDMKHQYRFYRSLRYDGDTLIVLTDSVDILHPDNDKAEYKESLRNIEAAYLNGKLIKKYD